MLTQVLKAPSKSFINPDYPSEPAPSMQKKHDPQTRGPKCILTTFLVAGPFIKPPSQLIEDEYSLWNFGGVSSNDTESTFWFLLHINHKHTSTRLKGFFLPLATAGRVHNILTQSPPSQSFGDALQPKDWAVSLEQICVG